jgi:LacI family transcriptional regulator
VGSVQRSTIKEVAKEAGVSTATISRVLNETGYVNEQVRVHVLETIKRMNYRPNAIARRLKQEKTRTIGIVFPDMANPYFQIIARSIQKRCIDEGYLVILMDTEEDAKKEKDALNFLLENRVEAVILAGTGKNVEQIEAMHVDGTHVILLDRKIDGLMLDTVTEESRNVVQETISSLIRRGHQRIGIINGPQTVSTATERYQGVLDAFEENELVVSEQLLLAGDFTKQFGIDAAYYFMRLSPAPTAIFSANNEMTFGFYLGLHEMNIPLDAIEVVSFGDLDFFPFFENNLTVIVQNPREIGDLAGQIAMERIKGGSLTSSSNSAKNIVFSPQLTQKLA